MLVFFEKNIDIQGVSKIEMWNGMTHFLFDFWNLPYILGLLDVKCLFLL